MEAAMAWATAWRFCASLRSHSVSGGKPWPLGKPGAWSRSRFLALMREFGRGSDGARPPSVTTVTHPPGVNTSHTRSRSAGKPGIRNE